MGLLFFNQHSFAYFIHTEDGAVRVEIIARPPLSKIDFIQLNQKLSLPGVILYKNQPFNIQQKKMSDRPNLSLYIVDY